MKSTFFKFSVRALVLMGCALPLFNLNAQVLLYRPKELTESFSPATRPFITRKFELDAEKFRASEFATVNDVVLPQEQMRAFFARQGLDFPEMSADSDSLSWSQPGRAFFYNERLGALWLRASREDIRKAEAALSNFLLPFVKADNWQASGFSGAMPRRLPAVQLITHFAELSDETLRILGMESRISTTWGATNVSVLTEPQFRIALQTLQAREGVDLVTAPAVRTVSGRQARLEIENTKQNLSPQTPPPVPRDTSPDADPTPAVLFKERTLKIPGL